MNRRPFFQHVTTHARTIILAGSLLAGTTSALWSQAKPARNQTQIKGLLVIQLGNGDVAGTASQMNATVVPGPLGTFDVEFNQRVGPMMKGATAEVVKFLRVRHGEKLPSGIKVELAFADKHSPKDGPSAAVVSALMADSIITGADLDQGFAATGDMTATGDVRPVGGIAGKVRGALKKKCSVIGVPKSNQVSIEDIYIIDGIKQLYDIQIFTLATFDEANALATSEKDEKIQKAIDDFALVQKALQRNPKLLANSKVKAKLKSIVQAVPNHLSARILFLHAIKRGPKSLSLPGSLTAIDKAARNLGKMLSDGTFFDTKNDVLRDFVSDMKRLRPMLDQRTKEFADTYEELADYLVEIRGRRQLNAQNKRVLDAHIRKVQAERDKLLNNKEIREELMIED